MDLLHVSAGTYQKGFGTTHPSMFKEHGCNVYLAAEIRLNTEVTKEYVENEAPDALIIAVGSMPLIPPIEGLNGDNVIVVNNYYKESEVRCCGRITRLCAGCFRNWRCGESINHCQCRVLGISCSVRYLMRQIRRVYVRSKDRACISLEYKEESGRK